MGVSFFNKALKIGNGRLYLMIFFMVTFFSLITLPLIKYKWSNKTAGKLSGIISGEIYSPNEFKCKALHQF